ncbi:MAG: hypothetical protein WC291_02915 [Thermodesulfovibrionales bacterium]|jgi:hypothetical protein
MAGKSKDDIILTDPKAPHKPKGLLDALSEIQQYFIVEKEGSPVPEDFFTIKGEMSFFGVGFKSAFLSGLISVLFTPIALGVVDKYIPIFGSYEPNLFDRFMAFSIALGFTVGYGAFIARLRKYYIGRITRTAIRWLLGGIYTGAAIKAVFAFVLFHIIYFLVLTPKNVTMVLIKNGSYLKPETKVQIFEFLMNFKPIFLSSAYFVAISTFLLIAIPSIAIWRGGRKLAAIQENEQRWS